MNLKNLFFKEEESASPIEVKKQPLPQQPVSSPVVVGISSIDYKSIIEGELEKNNQPGLDFYEYWKSAEKLATQQLPEEQKAIINFTTFSVSGITTDKLITSSNFYLSIIDDKDKAFQTEINEAYDRRVTKRKEEITKLSDENKALADKIQANASRIQELTDKVYKAEQEIAVEKSSFSSTKAFIIESINKQINNIKTYLHATAK